MTDVSRSKLKEKLTAILRGIARVWNWESNAGSVL